MGRFIGLISTTEGAIVLVLLVAFVVVVAGGVIRLLRAKNSGRPDPAICIDCDFESPSVCTQCHNKPAHDMLVRELEESRIHGRFIKPNFEPDYNSTLDELNEMGLG